MHRLLIRADDLRKTAYGMPWAEEFDGIQDELLKAVEIIDKARNGLRKYVGDDPF